MSGVHATRQPELPEPENATVPYLDTLYDITATGVEPGEGVGLPEIEAFLHEHARAPKSLSEFKAFFERHGLSTRDDRPEHGTLRILDPLPAVEPPPPALQAPVVPGGDDDESVTRPGTIDAPGVAVPARRALGQTPLWIAAGVVLLMLGMAVAWTVLTLGQLRVELARAQAQGAVNQSAIERLDTQTDQIRGDLFDTGSAIRRFEEKHDLLLDTLLPAPVERP